MFKWQLQLLLLTFWSVDTVYSIDRSNLFPFGSPFVEDSVLKGSDNISSPEIKLAVPIAFYDQLYQSIYVSWSW